MGQRLPFTLSLLMALASRPEQRRQGAHVPRAVQVAHPLDDGRGPLRPYHWRNAHDGPPPEGDTASC